jgi:hypothetical protein
VKALRARSSGSKWKNTRERQMGTTIGEAIGELYIGGIMGELGEGE